MGLGSYCSQDFHPCDPPNTPSTSAYAFTFDPATVCSVPDTQLDKGLAVAFTGSYSPYDDVFNVLGEVAYTGTDGVVSTATAVPVTNSYGFFLPETQTITMSFPSVAYSAMAESTPATFSFSAISAYTQYISTTDEASQPTVITRSTTFTRGATTRAQAVTFDPPVFITNTITAATSTVADPTSTDLVTSTITNQVVEEAPRVTVTATQFEGTATSTADPEKETVTSTITPKPKKIRTRENTTTIKRPTTCPSAAVNRRTPQPAGPSQFLTEYCKATPASRVTVTQSETTTATETTISTLTQYAVTTSTSTFTATDSVFQTEPDKTVTVTPTITDSTTLLLPRGTITVTRTRTKYIGRPPHCTKIT